MNTKGNGKSKVSMAGDAGMRRLRLLTHFQQMPDDELKALLADRWDRNKKGYTRKDMLEFVKGMSDDEIVSLGEVKTHERMRVDLQKVIAELNDGEVEHLQEKVERLKERRGKDTEEATYSREFLDMMRCTISRTLEEQLVKYGAPKEALDLLDDLVVLVLWSWEAEESGKMVSPLVNCNLIDVVSNASKNIVAVGGAFETPMGETARRKVVSREQRAVVSSQ